MDLFEECKVSFENFVGETYGTYDKVDHMSFLTYCKEVNVNPFEFEIDDLILDYIKQDRAYEGCLN